MIDGQFKTEGSSIAIDDGKNTQYESLCGKCYIEKIIKNEDSLKNDFV